MANNTFIVPGAESSADVVINNFAWFPNISTQAARFAMRLDGTVTDERLKLALIKAMVEVNRELNGWRLKRVQEGHASLATVPLPDRRRNELAQRHASGLPWHYADDNREYFDFAPDAPVGGAVTTVGGENVYLHYYRAAVYALAAAECIDRLRSYDLGKTGQDRNPEQDATHNSLLRDTRYAIADILGTNRSIIDLI
jgi:hypothetical protein